MLEICTLASGSSGNCLLVSDGRTHVLVDAGISARRICQSLRALGVEPEELAGVCITHEHSDHIAGLATLEKQFALPVYTTRGTGLQLCYRIAFLEERLHIVRPGESFAVDGLEAGSFPTSHDAAESVGYTFTAHGRKAAVATDLGVVTQAVLDGVLGAQAAVVETNHDVEWLKAGPYPAFLKQRILGEQGHLSNDAGAELALRAVEAGAETLILGHLSAENNSPRRALETVRARLEAAGAADIRVEVAPRSELGRAFRV